MKKKEALTILQQGGQQTSYLMWLGTKKGVLAHNIESVEMDQDLIQEFVTLMHYVTHQLAKVKGNVITMDQAAQVVASPGADFNYMINPELALYGNLLHYVAVNGANLNGKVLENIVSSYLSAGRDLNEIDGKGQTPLMLALENKNMNLFLTLTAHGADPEALDPSGFTALHRIVEYIRIGEMDASILDVWVEKGYKTNMKDKDGCTVIDHLKYHQEEPIAAAMFIKLTILNAAHETYESKVEVVSLQDAVQEGDDNLVLKIISTGVGSTKLDEKGNSVLHYAADSGRVDLVEKLAKLGFVDFNMKAENGALPITQALVTANLELAKAFIAGGANINYQADNGDTLLHALCGAGMVDSIKVTIACGGRADIVSAQGRTALHELLYNAEGVDFEELSNMIKLLCENGASNFLDYKDAQGNDVIALALNCGEEISEIVQAIHLSCVLAKMSHDGEVDQVGSYDGGAVALGGVNEEPYQEEGDLV